MLKEATSPTDYMNIDLNRLLTSTKRIPWYYFSSILKSKQLTVSQGWEKTLSKLKQIANSNDTFRDRLFDLYPVYEDHLLHDEKVVKIYQKDVQTIEKLINFIDSIPCDSCPATMTFPFPLDGDGDQLSSLEFNRPYYVGNIESSEGLALLFLSKRFFVQRVKLNTFHEDNVVRDYLGDFDEVYGIKKQVHQFFDIVFLNKAKGIIEVRLDNIEGLNSKAQEVNFLSIERKFENLFSATSEDYRLNRPVNFYPLLDRLYQDDNEGQVCELGFVTDEGSIKNERMRMNRTDLRSERYHSAGKKAVEHITLFKIAIGWLKKDRDNEPTELKIFGTIKDVARFSQSIDSVICSRCFNELEYRFILNKVITLLGL